VNDPRALRAHLVVGVVALRRLRPRRAGGSSHHWPRRTQPARRSARRDGSQREPFHRVGRFAAKGWRDACPTLAASRARAACHRGRRGHTPRPRDHDL